MPWNWELPNWPQFTYNPDFATKMEQEFLLNSGEAIAYLKTIDQEDFSGFLVEILTLEGFESSKIEGEFLDRESLQSSIRKQFGLYALSKKGEKNESGLADLLCTVYKTFKEPLTHEMLYNWHTMLFRDQGNIEVVGHYRKHPEPMQIVSNRYGSSIVYFEAPPSDCIFYEMTQFLDWFNASATPRSILEKAAIAHLYFESIHPFEDGNGRIGRILVEKVLSQEVGRPVLIAVSKVLEKRKKEYYLNLEKCNQTLDVQDWIDFFSRAILEAQQESMTLLYFLIAKSKLFIRLAGQLNVRQEKAILRMFAEGPNGFKGGLNAEKYIAITKASRATTTRDLLDLVEKGALIKTGELRHTRYHLNLLLGNLHQT
jgi:Fic family protein